MSTQAVCAALGLLVGASEYMRRLWKQLSVLAMFPWPVVIVGETGTGKGIVAEALHRLAGLPPDKLVRFSCATVPDHLVESLLFGHEQGAFTDARRRHVGYVERALGGSLCGDDLQDVSASLGKALLDVLDGKPITPVGGTRGYLPNLRPMFCSQQAPAQMPGLRRDLRARLVVSEVSVVQLLPLREHTEDIPALSTEMLTRAARESNRDQLELTTTAIDALMRYSWPDNVRQLGNSLRGAFMTAVAAGSPVIDVEHLGSIGRETSPGRATKRRVSNQDMHDALDASGGVRSVAARALGVSVRTVQRRIAAGRL